MLKYAIESLEASVQFVLSRAYLMFNSELIFIFRCLLLMFSWNSNSSCLFVNNVPYHPIHIVFNVHTNIISAHLIRPFVTFSHLIFTWKCWKCLFDIKIKIHLEIVMRFVFKTTSSHTFLIINNKLYKILKYERLLIIYLIHSTIDITYSTYLLLFTQSTFTLSL